MGHIELHAPVAHIWYFRNAVNYIALLLEMPSKAVEKVVSFGSWLVLDPGDGEGLVRKQLLTDEEFRDRKIKGEKFVAKKGAEAFLDLLRDVDLYKMRDALLVRIKGKSRQDRAKAVKELDVVTALINNSRKPTDMIMTRIPVIPPDLRPLVQLEGGRFASDDLNELYRRVINRNNRLGKMIDENAPEILLQNEKRMLQDAVDALLDNSKRQYPVINANGRPLRSLSDKLKGKEGRFRQNLLGKRVDYSGRAVIVSGPQLKISQCGVPKEMALELFKPHVIYRLMREGVVGSMKVAKDIVEKPTPEVWNILEKVVKGNVVLLNRAPTLHRLSIQAFEPVLIDEKAIQISPLVCTPFNADFDGDQMAIHLPLSLAAQTEARLLMLSSYNIFSPASGNPMAGPVQDMVLGAYYLTYEVKEKMKAMKWNSAPVYSEQDVLYLFESGKLHVHDPILVRIGGSKIRTTAGRVVFNDELRAGIFEGEAKYRDFPFQNKTMPKKEIEAMILDFSRQFGVSKTSVLLDNIKALGFKYATESGMSIGLSDMEVPPERKHILDDADRTVREINAFYDEGLLSYNDRYLKVVKVWQDKGEEIERAVFKNLTEENSVRIMADSGARGSKKQIVQMTGIRGLMSDPSGKIIEFPIKSNLREGLSVLEYFLSTHGTRKGQADTALKTSDSGYLTRRLVDVAHELVVREVDCTHSEAREIKIGNLVVSSLSDELAGKIADERVVNPLTGEVIIQPGEEISWEQAKRLESLGLKSLKIQRYVGGLMVQPVMDGGAVIVGLREQIAGRYAADDIVLRASTVNVNPVWSRTTLEHILDRSLAADIVSPDGGRTIAKKSDPLTDKVLAAAKRAGITSVAVAVDEDIVLVPKDGLIRDETAIAIEQFGITSVRLRSPITCQSENGVCAMCYGRDLSNGNEVQVGEAVGVIAAQSIGEPGTQLTLRTFHTGGIAVVDITTGLPRVEEIFEGRTPKGQALVSSIDGIVHIVDVKEKSQEDRKQIVISGSSSAEAKFKVAPNARFRVKDGDHVSVGDQLTEGSIDPKNLLELVGVEETARYLVQEVQKVYRSQGVDINVKHVEMIIRQMLKKVKIIDPGDTTFFTDQIVSKHELLHQNRKVRAQGGRPASFDLVLQGITKSSLETDSFLSAASFQETPRVLADAAIKGKIDRLTGLKEAVIVGKSIPAGTSSPELIFASRKVQSEPQSLGRGEAKLG
jgi:DNA-directed RNA polymerase subunit beta'